MKRLLALAMAISIASCDSSMKAADGTSSETQTALQALADNVREAPGAPGSVDVRVISAARSLSESGDGCGWWVRNWTRGGWHQLEFYDGKNNYYRDTSTAWASIRNELATDRNGDSLEACPSGYMVARNRMSMRSKAGVLYQMDGRIWRDRDTGGMTDEVNDGWIRYPSGFRIHMEGRRKSPNIGVESDTLRERLYSFAEGRYSFTACYSAGEVASGVAKGSVDDSVQCAPIQDSWNGGIAVGSFCENTRSGAVTVHDASGEIVWPNPTNVAIVDDSMGLRILSTKWDGDSVRIGFLVRTAPFPLRQWTRTSVIVDGGWLVLGVKNLPQLDLGGAEPFRGEIAISGQGMEGGEELSIKLRRQYETSESEWFTLGTWRVVLPARDR